MKHEASQWPEIKQPKLDVLIVLGKNIGVDWTTERIRKTTSSLSPWSCLNANAAGVLYRKGITQKIVFSSGHTAGKDIRSEAQAMKDLLKQKFPEIPEDAIILEEESIDTAGNAEKVREICRKQNFKNVGLLTIGSTGHLRNSRVLFGTFGVNVEKPNSFASEQVIASLKSNPHEMLKNFRNARIIKEEKRKEIVRSFLLYSFDPKGKILRQVTQRARK